MIRIGTRGSQLALWQAHDLQSKLTSKGIASDLIIIKTKGDRIQDLSFDKMEGKGFFTKEIEEALIDERIDVAVHSLKDLSTEMDDRLCIAGLSKRANPYDILIINKDHVDHHRTLKIKKGIRVGTSSIRRQVQVAHFDSEAVIVPIRGNVATRIKRIDKGEVEAVVLAAAGVDRLKIDLSSYEVLRFNPLEFIPAPAQGVVGYQCRTEDLSSRNKISKIHHSESADCTNVEREILKMFNGGCQLPLGAYVYKDDQGNYHAHAMLGTLPGHPLVQTSCTLRARLLVSRSTL